jgi:hypothetical protein
MSTLTITYWYHEEDHDYTVEIAGRLHSHVSDATFDDLVEYAVVAARLAATESTQLETETRSSDPDDWTAVTLCA